MCRSAWFEDLLVLVPELVIGIARDLLIGAGCGPEVLVPALVAPTLRTAWGDYVAGYMADNARSRFGCS
jgi:hypothetical protein